MKKFELITGIALAIGGVAMAVSAIREDTCEIECECICECCDDEPVADVPLTEI